jgi:hypothetical protein
MKSKNCKLHELIAKELYAHKNKLGFTSEDG